MGEAGAAADAITGGVLARAAKPRAGEGAGHTHERACLNCGAALAGPYCHKCGQHAHVHRTLSAFGHDLLHGVFHFEGKIARTVPMLVTRPGVLTRRYIAGERARFVSPLAMFLFSVFLMFAVFGAFGGGLDQTMKGSPEFKKNLAEGTSKAEQNVAQLQRARDLAARQQRPTAALDAKIKDARNEATLMRTMSEKGIVDGSAVRVSDDLPAGLAWLQKAYIKGKQNPSLLLYKLQNTAYKYSWALIPISAPFMWLLFPFYRSFRMYDHVVFVTYSLVFMSMLAILLELFLTLDLPKPLFKATLTIVPPVHLYLHLKGAYRLRWWSALLRLPLLMLFAGSAFVIFALSLVLLGVL